MVGPTDLSATGMAACVLRQTSPTDKDDDGESKQTDGSRMNGAVKIGKGERRSRKEGREKGRSDVISINFRASLRFAFFVGEKPPWRSRSCDPHR